MSKEDNAEFCTVESFLGRWHRAAFHFSVYAIVSRQQFEAWVAMSCSCSSMGTNGSADSDIKYKKQKFSDQDNIFK